MKTLKLLIFLFACSILHGQSTITIGAGSLAATGANYNPIYRSSASSSFDYNRAFYLFDAAELAAAGLPSGATIIQVAWDKGNNGATVTTTSNVVFNVFMNNSAATAYVPNSWSTLISGATVVYTNNTQAIPATIGYLPFTLTTPFVYTGGALEIATDWDISAVAGNPTTAGFSFSYTSVANKVGGTSSSVPLTGSSLLSGQSNRPNIRIVYLPPAPCTGAPNSGTANINNSSGCPGFPFTISASGLTSASGLLYQWQSSSTPTGPWASVPNATNTAFSTSVSATTYYRIISTCTISTQSATSSVTSYSVVNPGPCICAQYGSSGATSTADEEILGVTFGTMNNVSTCTTTAPGPGSILNRYSNYTGFVTAPAVLQGQNVPFTVNVGTCGGNYDNATKVFIDFNQNGSFADPGEEVYASPVSVNGPNLISGNILIPITASIGTTRMRVVNVETTAPAAITPTGTFSWGETEDYCITIQAPLGCTGTPNNGIAAINTPSGCPNVNLSITTSSLSIGLGISYQWFSSPNPTGPWTSIPSGTNVTYTTNAVSSTTYFQMVTTCSTSAQSATTNVVGYQIVNPGPCICAQYGSSSASFAGDEEILGVQFGTLNNVSTCTTTAPGPGSILSRYSNYTGFVSAPTVLQGQSVPFTVNVGTCGGNFDSGIKIYIDFNQNGSFSDPGEEVYVSPLAINGPYLATGNVLVPITASVGITRMRVVNVETTAPAAITPTGTYGYGETEDYCIDIQAPLGCTGTPNNGIAAINTPSGCPNVNLSITTSSLSIGLGISYQWFSSPNPTGPWTSIPSGTNVTYTTNAVSSTTYFQMVTTCSTSAQSATTNVVGYQVVNPGPCICAQYGSSGATSTADEEIVNVSFGTLNNPSTCTTTAPGLGSIQNRYSNYTGFVNAPVVLQGQNVPYGIDINTCGGWYGMQFNVYIDFNQNGLFTDPGELVVNNTNAIQGNNTGNILIPATASVGITRMRIVAVEGAVPGPTGTYSWGETEDYCIDIQTPLPCSGAPASGTAAISTATGCITDVFNLSATGVTNGLGISYQWQSATSASGPWAPVATATNLAFSTTASVTTFFQLVTTCSVSALSATSSIVSYTPQNCYLMSNATITACGGTLYDTGGPNNNYLNNENYTLTIVPATPGSSVQLSFSSFSVETCCDYLQIYNGANTSAPLIGQYTTLPPNITATNSAGVLTLRFFSDGSVVYSGFAAAITCTSACSGPPSAPTSASISICSGNSATLASSSSTAGTIQWYSSATATNYIAQGTVFVTPVLSVSTTYFVKDSTACGISPATAVNVTVIPTPTLNAVSTATTLCTGNSATLTASGMNTYTWSTTSNSSAIVVTPSVTSNYTVVGTSTACNITQNQVLTINVNQTPTVSLSAAVSTICVLNGSVSLTGSPSGGLYSGTAVTGSLLSVANAGTYTPMYSYTNSLTGCSNTATTQVIVSNCTGVNEAGFSTNGVRVYPNPNSGSFVIETNNNMEKAIEIMDVTGRVVISEKSTNDRILMTITNLANGMYQVRVLSEKGVDMIKVIKQ